LPAAGAGLSIALACDFRVAADSAGFNTAFVGVGLVVLVLVQRLGIILRDSSSTILRQQAWVVISKQVMQKLAETDPVTVLFNRRHFDRRLDAELNRALRAESLLSLLMIDVDHFKSINDRFGHRTGDAVLRAVATGIKQAVRLYDVPTRYGGDEFAVILPEADSDVASRVARRVLEKTAQQPLPPDLAAADSAIGLSIGIATYPRPSGDSSALIEFSDIAGSATGAGT